MTIEIRGSDLEGWWFVCACGKEGELWNTRQAAETDAYIHKEACKP